MENTDRINPIDTREKFAEDIRGVTEAAQEKLAQTEEQISKQTEEFKAAMASMSEAAQTALNVLGEQLAAGARVTDRAIREKPYQSAGIAFGVGILIGFLIKRR